MVKKIILTPFVHLLWFLVVFIVAFFFIVTYGTVVSSLPGTPNPSLFPIAADALWDAFLIAMPLSLFLVIFFIRRRRSFRFLSGIITLVTATLLYAACFIALQTLIAPSQIRNDRGPRQLFVEGMFHRFGDVSLYPFTVKDDGSPGESLLIRPGENPCFSLQSGFSLQRSGAGVSLVASDGYRLSSPMVNPVVEPYIEPPAIVLRLSYDLETSRDVLLRAREDGLMFFLLMIGVQCWFCIQSWVIVRAGRWPLMNAVLGIGLFWLFLRAHWFFVSDLWLRFLDWLPSSLPYTAITAGAFFFLALPLFFWNIFSSGEAAGHE